MSGRLQRRLNFFKIAVLYHCCFFPATFRLFEPGTSTLLNPVSINIFIENAFPGKKFTLRQLSFFPESFMYHESDNIQCYDDSLVRVLHIMDAKVVILNNFYKFKKRKYSMCIKALNRNLLPSSSTIVFSGLI